MKERIYYKDIKLELEYHDTRSIRRWCKNNHVRILSDIGSNKKFVLRSEFEKAINRSYLLKGNEVQISKKDTDYKPQGEYEKQFLSRLINLIPTI
jgi:hypothetical protein